MKIFLVSVTDFKLDGSVETFPSCAYEKSENASIEAHRIQQADNPVNIKKRIVIVTKVDYD